MATGRPSSACVLPQSLPFGQSFTAKLVGLPSVALAGAQGCNRGTFHKIRETIYFLFYFFLHGAPGCAAPANPDPATPRPCGCLRLGCTGGQAGQHLAPQQGNLLPWAGWGGEAAGTQPTHAGVQHAEGWLWDKLTAQEGEPQGLGRISKRREDGGWEQERGEGLAGAGSHQAAHATVQGLARHHLALAPAIWSSGSPLVPSLL